MSRLNLLFSICLVLALLVGCSNSDSGSGDDSSSSLSADTTQALVAADKLDGAEDKVVHKCYGCALGMDSDKEIASTFGGYTAHFCHENCKEAFEKDPEQLIADNK